MKRTFFFLLALCSLLYASAMDFKHLGITDGLSDSQINHITKDSQGFIWFSTSYGLNRYDGYTVKVFTRNSKDPHSLPDNFVTDVQEDAEGFLWVHTGRFGYTFYDPQKETFHPSASRLQNKYGISEEPDYLYIDKGKNIWCYHIGSGMHGYDVKTGRLMFSPVSKKLTEQDAVLLSMTEDKNNVICLYANGYIERISKSTGQVESADDYLVRTPDNLQPYYSIFSDSDGDCWICSYNGLWVYYARSGCWQFLDTRKESPYVLSGLYAKDVIQDIKGKIWIATDHGGINIIDKNLHTIEYIKNNLLDERSIVQNSINCLYCDDVGIVWAGTYKRGVSYYNESIFKFRIDHLPEFNSIKNFAADVNVVVEDKQANLWIGTNNSGLIYLDRETNERKIYQYAPGKGSVSGNVIVSMLATSDGKIWMGTYQNGLNCFDGNKFVHYRHDPKKNLSLVNDNIWALAEGENGYIWIGTLGSGLQGLDPRTGIFTQYAKSDSVFGKDYIASICISRDKNIYMATSYGITVYSPLTGTFRKWIGNQRGTQEFLHQNINEIYEDSRGLLWIATQEGLNIYDRKKDEIIIPVDETVFGGKIIQGIIEDNNKNMWVTTTKDILNITVHVEQATGEYSYGYHPYNDLDGLQHQQFNPRSIIKDFRGEIIVGGVEGLTFFNPENLKYNYNIPKVEFTELQLFNKEVKINSLYNGNRILTKALNRTTEIKLKHSQNVFSVSFSAMNYILPGKTKYMYMLEGFNPEWLTADANKLTYTNLAPGTYTLRVKAVNGDGFGSKEDAMLKIVITPPFWISPLACILYLMLAISILLLARRQIMHNERNRYKLMQVEQEALQKHEIDDMKLRFFTNISHELRTPLTLIISPLESVIKNIESIEQKSKLQMVHRNAMRLLTMVNQLLDFRKSDVRGHQFNPAQGDIIDYIRNVSNSFIEYSEKKDVYLTFFSSIPELLMVFDEDKIGKIIMNLLSNAFKFTPEGGRVDVSLSILSENEQEQLEIRISDTGIGIDDEDKGRIFERFYQVQDTKGQKSGGSGIGLHLVKEFITLHGGTISVIDNAGRGSVFIIILPVMHVEATKQEGEIKKQIANSEENLMEETLSELAGSTENKETKPSVILIVDDNDDFRLFMKDSLKFEYQVQEAASGAKAWKMIPELQPDIIISDVMMPEMDGNELSRLVKTDIRTSHIPLILLTARSAKEQKLEGLESGADDYITKPFDFDILVLRIKRLLQMRQKRQESFSRQMEVAPSEITITSLDEKLIKKAVRYVEDNMARSELSVEELSHELGMSRVHLYKKLLSITGKTPIEFIRVIRLKRGAQLLRESQQTISEIAYQVGFNSPKYFRKYFKEEFGILPSGYQEKEGI